MLAAASACCAPLISSFLFQARIISFFHFERHTKDKQSFASAAAVLLHSLLLFFTVITSNAGNLPKERKKMKLRQKNFKHWYKFLWWFTDRKSCDVGGKSRRLLIFFLFALHRYTLDDRRESKVFFRIHKCLNKHQRWAEKKIVFS